MKAALQSSVSVLAMELPWIPGGEREIVVPEGLSIAEMVDRAFPGAPEEIIARVRVVMYRDGEHALVYRQGWSQTYPHGGTEVVVQLAPGNGLRSILQVVISVAAIAIANFLAPGIGMALGLSEAFVKGALTLGLTALGGILLNAMFRDGKKQDDDRPTQAAFGWRNAFTPDGAIPVLFGELRVAPPHAAGSYIEIVGDEVFLRAAFDFGYGPLAFSGRQRIGDTPAGDFQEFSEHTVEGLPDDPFMRYYRRQVITEEVGVELERPWPRDDDGKIRDDLPSVSTPIRRVSAYDVSRIVDVLSFPTGLGYVSNKGKKNPFFVTMRRRIRLFGNDVTFVTIAAMEADLDHDADTRAFVEQDAEETYFRKVGASGTGSWEPDWIELPDLTIRDKKFAGLFRADTIFPPERGRWMVEREMLTDTEDKDANENQNFRKCDWQVLQSFRPEYPIAMDRPLALTSALVRSTTKMKGTLDSFNDVPKRIARDWDPDTQEWVWRPTRNVSAAAIFALTGPATARPAPDAGIDWPKFEAWAEMGFTYDAFHDQDGEALEDALRAIGSAGRAVVYHDGHLWTVYIDRPSDLVADQINGRNAWNLSVTASYFRPVDAHRVRFQDRTADYEWRTRLVPWPPDVRFETKDDLEADLDHRAGTRAEVYDDETPQYNAYYRKVGAVGEGSWQLWPHDEVEDMDIRGITDAGRAWIEARRRQYEAMHRSSVWSATIAGTLTAPRIGDQVLASRDFLSRTSSAARVVQVLGNMVVIDGAFTMVEGIDYAIRFRVDETDTDLGRSVVRTIATVAGERSALTLTGGSDTGDASLKPSEGAVIQFGPAGSDSRLLVVTEVTRTEDSNSVLTMLPAAPIIDELTDAEVPPPWNGRVGEIVAGTGEAPMPPTVTGVTTGASAGGEGMDGNFYIFLAPAAGETVEIERYEVQHKIVGAGSWDGPATGTVASGSVELTGYVNDDVVVFQARAVSFDEVPSEWGPEITVTVGSEDAEIPGEPSFDAGGNLGHAWLDILVPSGDSAIAVEIFANASGDVDFDTDFVRSVNITPGVPLAVADGDTTRATMIEHGDFASGTGWELTGDWAITGGQLVNSTSTASSYARRSPLSAFTSGETYRYSFDLISTNGTGTLRFRIFGSSEPTDTDDVSAPANHDTTGTVLGGLVANADSTKVGFAASSARMATIDNLAVYRATSTCLPQGPRRYWVRGVNDDGIPGPAVGPVIVTIL